MGEMRIMDDTGDSKMVWDPKNEDEVEVNRETFNRLKRKGYQAFSVGPKGTKGKLITEFDPDAGSIIMAPRPAGG